MSVIVSGIMINPVGEPVANAQITLTAVTNSLTVLNSFSVTVKTDSVGAYRIQLEEGSYSITVAANGRSRVYGAVTLDNTTGPSTLNQLLKQQIMESELTPDVILYFRQIQQQVANDLATIKVLENSASDSAISAGHSRDEARQYASDLSGALALAKGYRDEASVSASAANLSQTKSAESESKSRSSEEASLRSEENALIYRNAAQTAAATAADDASTLAAEQTAEKIKLQVKTDADRAEVARVTSEQIKGSIDNTALQVAQQHSEALQAASDAESSKNSAATSAGNAQSSATDAGGAKDAAANSAETAQQNAETTTADRGAAKGFRDEAEVFTHQAQESASSIDIPALQADIDQKLDKSGGRMTGGLILHGDAIEPLEAVTKQQLDAAAGFPIGFSYGWDNRDHIPAGSAPKDGLILSRALFPDMWARLTASWAGFKKALRTDDSLVDMMFAGATFGGGYSNVYDPASTAKTIRSVLRRKGYNDSQIQEFESSIVRNSKEVMGKVEQGLHKYKNLSEAAENANRLATYEAAIKSGKSKALAAFESRDLMDFSMMGASNIMINLSDMLPFFNARMQGLSKLGRGIKENPREVLKRGGMITAASLALMALNWDDKRYEELQDWDKDTYWHAWIGDQHIRFPKPFEIGLMFGTLPERFIRALGGKDTGAKFGKLVAHNFMETMAFNPIPQVAMPIAEAYVNYDFFKGGPIENIADSNLIAGARYNDQTSLLMREVGEATNMSPKMLDHIVMGYTGSLGGYVMGATNLLMRNLKDYGETPAMRLDEMPVIKSFFRGSDPAKSTQFTEDFYRMMTEANQINSTINSFRKQGRGDDANELIEENRGKLSQRQGLTATQKQVKALNAQIEMMRRDRILTADQKREKIDRLMATRNKLVQQAVERVNPYFNK